MENPFGLASPQWNVFPNSLHSALIAHPVMIFGSKGYPHSYDDMSTNFLKLPMNSPIKLWGGS